MKSPRYPELLDNRVQYEQCIAEFSHVIHTMLAKLGQNELWERYANVGWVENYFDRENSSIFSLVSYFFRKAIIIDQIISHDSNDEILHYIIDSHGESIFNNQVIALTIYINFNKFDETNYNKLLIILEEWIKPETNVNIMVNFLTDLGLKGDDSGLCRNSKNALVIMHRKTKKISYRKKIRLSKKALKMRNCHNNVWKWN